VIDQLGSSKSEGQHSYGEDEVDFLELWGIVVKSKRMILRVAFSVALLAAAGSLLIPNIYRAAVLTAPVFADGGDGGQGGVLSGLSGLASMAGVSVGQGGNTEENIAVLKSKEFLWKFTQDNGLMPILFPKSWLDEILDLDRPGQWDVYRFFIDDERLIVDVDKDSGIVTIAIEWKDAAMAAQWANALVDQLNYYLAQQAITQSEINLQFLNKELMRTSVEEMRKTLFNLIANEQKNVMLANTQKNFAFRVLDHAVKPDRKVKPKRSIIVILSALMAALMASVYAVIKERSRLANVGRV
jgi:capsular polysaccharide biosynthesis protein